MEELLKNWKDYRKTRLDQYQLLSAQYKENKGAFNLNFMPGEPPEYPELNFSNFMNWLEDKNK